MNQFGALWHHIMRRGLQRVGCDDPARLVEELRKYQAAGMNQFTLALMGVGIDPGEYSRLINSGDDDRRFLRELSHELVVMAPRVLAALGKPRHVKMIVDPHEEDYHPGRSVNESTPRHRSYFQMVSAASNHSSTCNRMLGIVLSWNWRGRTMFWPVHWSLRGAGELGPGPYADEIERLLRVLKVKIQLIIVDREFGTKDFVRRMAELGQKVLARINIGATGQTFYTKSGQKWSVHDMIDHLRRGNKRIVEWKLRARRGHKTVIGRVETRVGRLSPDGPLVRLHLKACLQPAAVGWSVDWDHSIAWVENAGFTNAQASQIFYERWHIEMSYHILALNSPATRPQLTRRWEIEWAAHALRMTLGFLAATYVAQAPAKTRRDVWFKANLSSHLAGTALLHQSGPFRLILRLIDAAAADMGASLLLAPTPEEPGGAGGSRR